MSLFTRSYETFLQKELFGCGRWAKPEAAPSPLWLFLNSLIRSIRAIRG